MDFSWTPITAAQHAEYERLLAPVVVKVGDLFWRRVRPFFYRPLQQWREFDPAAVRRPRGAILGCAQFAVPPGAFANSSLNCLSFEDPGTYSPECLDYNRKRQVRLAAKVFAIRPVTNREEFKQSAYPAYLSFYERTGYRVGAQRRKAAVFGAWADALFEIPGILVLGGYRDGKLGGISLSFQFADAVVYASFFCDTPSLRHGLGDLMLHAVRTAAAATPGLARILTGGYHGVQGVDTFYLLRGATILRKPALLRLNPAAGAFMRRCLPALYARLLGRLNEQELKSALPAAPGRTRPVATKPEAPPAP